MSKLLDKLTPEAKALLKELEESGVTEDLSDSSVLVLSGQEFDKDSNGDNWTPANIVTLMIWISMAYYQLKILEVAIKYNRDIVRNNVILGFILSTASGTISAATFGGQSSDLNLKLSILFTVMSFVVSIYAAFIKIFQIQENLEKFIKNKQEWIGFSTYIISELHLPITHRYDAMKIIKKNKEKYLQLLKSDLEINWRIRQITRNQIARKERKRDANKWIFQKGYDLPTILMNSLHKLNLEYNYLMSNKREVSITDPSLNQDKVLLNCSLDGINHLLNKQLVKTYHLQLDISGSEPIKREHIVKGVSFSQILSQSVKERKGEEKKEEDEEENKEEEQVIEEKKGEERLVEEEEVSYACLRMPTGYYEDGKKKETVSNDSVQTNKGKKEENAEVTAGELNKDNVSLHLVPLHTTSDLSNNRVTI
jgi:hypothetical protein